MRCPSWTLPSLLLVVLAGTSGCRSDAGTATGSAVASATAGRSLSPIVMRFEPAFGTLPDGKAFPIAADFRVDDIEAVLSLVTAWGDAASREGREERIRARWLRPGMTATAAQAVTRLLRYGDTSFSEASIRLIERPALPWMMSVTFGPAGMELSRPALILQRGDQGWSIVQCIDDFC